MRTLRIALSLVVAAISVMFVIASVALAFDGDRSMFLFTVMFALPLVAAWKLWPKKSQQAHLQPAPPVAPDTFGGYGQAPSLTDPAGIRPRTEPVPAPASVPARERLVQATPPAPAVPTPPQPAAAAPAPSVAPVPASTPEPPTGQAPAAPPATPAAEGHPMPASADGGAQTPPAPPMTIGPAGPTIIDLPRAEGVNLMGIADFLDGVEKVLDARPVGQVPDWSAGVEVPCILTPVEDGPSPVAVDAQDVFAIRHRIGYLPLEMGRSYAPRVNDLATHNTALGASVWMLRNGTGGAYANIRIAPQPTS